MVIAWYSCNACVECKQQSDLARAGWQSSPGQLCCVAGRHPVRCLFAKVLSGMARCSRTKAYGLHHAAWPTTGGWMAWLHAFTKEPVAHLHYQGGSHREDHGANFSQRTAPIAGQASVDGHQDYLGSTIQSYVHGGSHWDVSWTTIWPAV